MPSCAVMIGVDPHKASWTAVAVDRSHRPLGSIRVEATQVGYRRLRAFARRWPEAVWAIEGARGLGVALTARLHAESVEVLDVPAKLAHRVRLLSTGHGRKSDEADALSVAIAALGNDRLSIAHLEEATAALRVLTEHRDDLVRARTQTANRLHGLLARLTPTGLPRRLTAELAAEQLRHVRPRDQLRSTLRQVAVELLGEMRRLDRRIAKATSAISAAVTASQTGLTAIHGVGDLVAAKILAHTSTITRFRSEAAFASYCGVAPIEVSSGDVQRHRLSRAGDRQLNYALHVIAITQIRSDTTGRAYYQRKRAAGKGHKEALRCLKRHLATTVYRIMIRDSETSLLPTT